jgi:hypothetical protein
MLEVSWGLCPADGWRRHLASGSPPPLFGARALGKAMASDRIWQARSPAAEFMGGSSLGCEVADIMLAVK